jgi:ABC-type antimicrobial peptide transport system permease subunit
VQSLAYASLPPFRQTPPSEIRLANQERGQGKPASVDNVSTGFFSTFGIRLVAGRSFQHSDQPSAHPSSVAVVSQAFAGQFWPGENPVGKIIRTPDDRKLTVIGVAADTRSERFGITDGPRLYVLRDPAALDGELYVRFAGSAATAEGAVNDAVKAIDPLQLAASQTIWESLEEQADSLRSLARIVVIMASIAVLFAVTGVYGVLSFTISQRTREFGIRMVLGANRAAVFRSILLRGGRQIAVGLACGLAIAAPAAWSLSRLLRNSPLPMLTFDVSMYAIVAGMLTAVSLAAMYLPAIRATQVDPMKALRTE